MTDTLFSLRVWVRSGLPRSRWVFWEAFSSGVEASNAIRAAKAAGKLAGETLTITGDRDPNEEARHK